MLDWKYVFARMTQNTLRPVGMIRAKGSVDHPELLYYEVKRDDPSAEQEGEDEEPDHELAAVEVPTRKGVRHHHRQQDAQRRDAAA